MKKYYILVLILASLASCQQRSTVNENNVDMPIAVFPYQLERYSKKYKMPSDLEEISGISRISNGLLACVQDEKGIVYVYDLEKDKVVKEIKFTKSGDFEDIEIVGNTAYILRSDGAIFRIDDFDGENKTIMFETPLNSKNDTEGLCYDKESNSLWIACKAAAGIDKRISGLRSIYAYALNTSEFIEQPVIKIDLELLSEIGEANVPFEPSGIAIHPITGDKYIISSVGRVLVVLDSQNEVKHLRSLRQKGFKQPEGICFDPDGTMYLSNEGRDGKGNILQFNYRGN